MKIKWFVKCLLGFGSVLDGSVCWFSAKFFDVHDYKKRNGGDEVPVRIKLKDSEMIKDDPSNDHNPDVCPFCKSTETTNLELLYDDPNPIWNFYCNDCQEFYYWHSIEKRKIFNES